MQVAKLQKKTCDFLFLALDFNFKYIKISYQKYVCVFGVFDSKTLM